MITCIELTREINYEKIQLLIHCHMITGLLDWEIVKAGNKESWY